MATQGAHREKRVTYYTPGVFFAEDSTLPIEDGPDIVQRATAGAPAGAFCFTLQTVLIAPPVPDGEGGTLRVMPKVVERTGRYYLTGRLFDQDDLRELGGDYAVLLSNMDSNGWGRVILTPQHNWQPFSDGDVLLTADAVSCSAL